jgi:hypothetical protein
MDAFFGRATPMHKCSRPFAALGKEVERIYVVATFEPAACSEGMLLTFVLLPIWPSNALACLTRRLGLLSRKETREQGRNALVESAPHGKSGERQFSSSH